MPTTDELVQRRAPEIARVIQAAGLWWLSQQELEEIQRSLEELG